MRIFDLFLRRAGIQASTAGARSDVSVSRLTVVCPRGDLAQLRRRIYSDLNTAGIRITNLEVDHSDTHDTAQACITLACAPDRRADLMQRARLIRDYPGVLNVKWAGRERIAIN
ncbi:hypothetical protein [Alcaligenes sp. SDU_A2]|uniref:hypothetical protein n=1 Tax=Alcaligenes sp. SDU_A2 TaxID=3136634 RepID=UPI002BFE314F|nr:hypothetical protein [Alcaligenes sp.]HRL26368.1 hypothetical protein [Alcaligenes sp.]